MNIVDLLKADHREAKNLLNKTENNRNQEAFNELKNALTNHTKIEEELFYPALEEFEECEDLIDEAYQEHNDVDQILEEMSEVEINGETFQELLFQLKESVYHHIEIEEEQILSKAEMVLDAEILEEMGNQAENLKNESLVFGI